MITTYKNPAADAVAKINQQTKSVTGNKEKAMASAVAAALRGFCIQKEAFADAVIRGGSFVDCMAAVAKGVGNSISDLDAYKKAVQFYFPGAQIKMQMSIDLNGNAAAPEEPQSATPMVLNLMDIL